MFQWSNCRCCQKSVLTWDKIGQIQGFSYACDEVDNHFVLYFGPPGGHKLIKVFDQFDDVEMFILGRMENQIKTLRRMVYGAKRIGEKEVLNEVMGS